MLRVPVVVLLAGWSSAAVAANEPVITHEPVTQVVPGETLELRATITSATAVPIGFANVFVRLYGVENFQRLDMQPSPEAADTFVVKLAPAMTDKGFDYYIEAFDNDGNGPAHHGTPDAPHAAVLAPPELAQAALDLPPPPAPVEPPSRLLTWSLAGAGVVAAIAGGALALKTRSLRAGDTVTDVQGVTTHSLSQAAAASSNTYALGANVAFGVAGALAVGAGVTFAFDI